MASSDSVAAFRRFYAEYVTARAGVANERIRQAFATVERERFAGPGPWRIAVGGGYISTGSDDPRLLYQDVLVGLLPAENVNNGEPSLHAKCLAEANPAAGEIVVHVGAGTGYYTAILAELVGSRGTVHAYEVLPELAARACANLQSWPQVVVYTESGLTHLPKADLIYVSAGVTYPPGEWLDALGSGGRLVLPLVPTERLGCMLRIERCGASCAQFAARIFASAGFIRCVGATDERSSAALAGALDGGKEGLVRSLRRHSAPDATAWCVGSDWWLSTAPPSGGDG